MYIILLSVTLSVPLSLKYFILMSWWS